MFYRIKLFILSALFICLSSVLYSQQDTLMQSPEESFESYSRLLSLEKLYLHTDREVYCAGDTIWFKGYLKNSSELSEFPESNYIYVELISSMVEKNIHTGKGTESEDIRGRVKVKRWSNGFSGYIPVPENLNTGIAVLRGYTYWMMNKEPEYMFNKNIEIRNPIKDDFVKEMVENKVYEENKYIEIGVSNPADKAKNDIKKDIDLQFLPESGRYVVGKNSVIAFKAINEQGLGIKVKGTLFIDQEQIPFESNDLGMGTITLNLPQMPSKATVQVTDQSGNTKTQQFPKPEEKAVVINCKLDTSALYANIYSKGIVPAANAYVVVYDASEIYFKAPYDMQDARVKLEFDDLSRGINNIAVIDDLGNVYANRTFFVFPDKKAETVTLDKAQYGPKERVSCTFDLKDEDGNPVSGDFSLSVSDNVFTPYSGTGHSIVSYMLLGSELNGLVERPQEYFNEDIPLKERIRSMDMLMLSQAWKYYDLPKILKGESRMPLLGREYTQSISGCVRGFFKVAKRSYVSFVAPSINFTTFGQLDTSGWFALSGLDFPDSTQFIVSAIGPNGSQRRFTPFMDEDIFAKFHSYSKYLKPMSYTNEYKYSALEEYYSTGGDLVYSLAPIYVRGVRTRQVENISPLPQYQFKEGQYRDAHELSAYKSYDLMTYIVSTCPPLRFGESEDTLSGGRQIVCRTGQIVGSRLQVESDGWMPIIVFINGVQCSCSDLEGMQTDDITGFAYLKGADAARFNTSGTLFPRSVVMIETKMLDRPAASNVTSTMPMGWQKPARSYYPKYTTAASKRGKELMRCTLFWEPDVKVEDGKAHVEFYTSGHYSDYTLILEGLTDEKQPVFIKKDIVRKEN